MRPIQDTAGPDEGPAKVAAAQTAERAAEGIFYVSDDGDASDDDGLMAFEFDGPAPGAAIAIPKRKTAKHPGLLLPETAIRWKNNEARGRQLEQWTSAFMRVFGTQARALRLGWIIKDLAAGRGHCFAGNEYLSDRTGLSIKRLDELLTAFERAGAVVRTGIATRKGRVRKIYLSVDIIAANPPKTGGLQTEQQSPRNGGYGSTDANPPKTGGWRNPPETGENDPPDLGGVEIRNGTAALLPPKNGSRG